LAVELKTVSARLNPIARHGPHAICETGSREPKSSNLQNLASFLHDPATNMAPAFLASIALGESDDQLKPLTYLGHVFATASDSSLALDFLRRHFGTFSLYLDVTKIQSLSEIETLLDAGVSKVFTSLDQFKALSPTISSDRLVITVNSDELPKIKEYLQQNPKLAIPSFHYDDASQAKPVRDGAVYYATYKADSPSLVEYISIIPASKLTTEPLKTPDLIPVTNMLLRHAVVDHATGLYATTVCDEQGVTLGLVWSSEESVAEALRTGTGVYQSRKRGLWYKGKSSGDTQELLRINLDCDQDCLQFIVKQSGRGEPILHYQTELGLTVHRFLSYRRCYVLWSIQRII
jgi:phosphoribosyl-ATP pyrophosphohydrolase / phosphoribosyl-AMP cyclohydrolase / histidinol dehydrogenase